MHSKVSSDWLSSYIKATLPVLEIFKKVGYFPDSPRKVLLFKLILVLSPALSLACLLQTI
jgi:hypothetical protein